MVNILKLTDRREEMKVERGGGYQERQLFAGTGMGDWETLGSERFQAMPACPSSEGRLESRYSAGKLKK